MNVVAGAARVPRSSHEISPHRRMARPGNGRRRGSTARHDAAERIATFAPAAAGRGAQRVHGSLALARWYGRVVDPDRGGVGDGSGAGSNAGRIGTIGALGTLVAPSFGHWYARSFLTRGLGLRVAGATATFFGLAILISQCEDECSNAGLAAALMLGGAGLYVGGTIDDIATAPGKVRRYNERFHDVALVPMIRGDSSGLTVAGRF